MMSSNADPGEQLARILVPYWCGAHKPEQQGAVPQGGGCERAGQEEV